MALESFAERVKRLRAARGFSERELAERIGMTVRQYRSAASSPTCALLLDVSAVLDLSISDLTEQTSEGSPTLAAMQACLVDRGLFILRDRITTETAAQSFEDALDALMSSFDRNDTLRSWGARYARLIVERYQGNKREACRVLGISYHTLQKYLRAEAVARRNPRPQETPAHAQAKPADSRVERVDHPLTGRTPDAQGDALTGE